MTTAHEICLVLIPLIIIVFLCLAKFSNLMRDDIDDRAAFLANCPAKYKNTPYEKIPKPFSLARTQLALWTTIVACVYVYLYFWVGCNAMLINKTALVVMGISAATTAAGNMIDKSQAQTNAATIAAAAPAAGGTPPVTPDPSITTPAAATPTTTPAANPTRQQNAPSEGFFKDLISDNDGVNIHRFQNVVWTVVSMVMYIYIASQTQYALNCGLPTLDDTLLAITGISNATYVGLKINENSL